MNIDLTPSCCFVSRRLTSGRVCCILYKYNSPQVTDGEAMLILASEAAVSKFGFTMRPLFLLLFLCLFFSETGHALNKCKTPDGKVTYQDAPCSDDLIKRAEESQRQKLELREQTKKSQEIEFNRKSIHKEAASKMQGGGGQDVMLIADACGQNMGLGIGYGLDTSQYERECGKKIDALTVTDRELRGRALMRIVSIVSVAVDLAAKGQSSRTRQEVQSALRAGP